MMMILPVESFSLKISRMFWIAASLHLYHGDIPSHHIMLELFFIDIIFFLLFFCPVVQKILEVGEVVVVDVACIVAMTSSIDFQLKQSNPMRRAVFGVSFNFYYFSMCGYILERYFFTCRMWTLLQGECMWSGRIDYSWTS